ncbi:hypothetical protein Sjap_025110 [Stephania japonica]|uniref:glycerophosphodiester phosphodiesterase n=1 Tax=Stephania japonica TaxID=461633 RepID=A0AAP0E8X8_9MAGN
MATLRALLLGLCVAWCVGGLVDEVSAQRSNKAPPKPSPWKTLNGNAPLVVARGGFSGIFPDSSIYAYQIAMQFSLPNVILWCDVQLTKDAVGICLSSLTINNVTNIEQVKRNEKKTYLVNGESTSGWFPIDYTLDDLQMEKITLIQPSFSRSASFDSSGFAIIPVDYLAMQLRPRGLWLNIQHDLFYSQHNLSMRSYVLSLSRQVIVNYVSSPEVGFLRSIVTRLKGSVTKLVFRFLDAGDIEPTTNQTYGALLTNLTFIKTFASGILVPKNYIWPVNSARYLLPYTSLVSDAHKEGLEVFAADFANDGLISFNYSYDPLSEYLSYFDNGDFSVDGVLSDFPITPSSTIDCFSHINKSSSGQAMPKVISYNGASGIYPGSTNLAYKQAVEDGADYIDCSVQMTSDGIPICLDTINLFDTTTVAQSPFNNLSLTVPEVQKNSGIFVFSLTWKDIQSLKPSIRNPWFTGYQLVRNPAYKNAGSFVSLADFLTFAVDKSLAGVLISIEVSILYSTLLKYHIFCRNSCYWNERKIPDLSSTHPLCKQLLVGLARFENAAYLARKQGLDVTGAVIDALKNSPYGNQTVQEVLIQSSNISVLTKFKEQTKYKLVYKVDENIRDADDASINDIKKVAQTVAISKDSVYPENQLYLTGMTDVVQRLQSFNLTVYTYLFSNEFVSQAWDFFSDPYVQINSFVMGSGLNGVITDYPGTAAMYRRNRCLTLGDKTPVYMSPVQSGGLLGLMNPLSQPPAEAPNPILTEQNVAESPLPPVSKPVRPGPNALAPAPPSPSGHPRLAACAFISSLLTLLACLLLH